MELSILLVIGLLLSLIWLALRSIEERLLAISRHLGLVSAAGSEPSDTVRALASDAGGYVEALRRYRAETGSDLRQAKRIVDPLRPRSS